MNRFALFVCFSAIALVQADLLSNALGSNMVLQRAPYNARLWGWTQTPGSTVSVTIGGNQYSTTSKADNSWNINLNPMSAGGPYTIYVKSTDGLSDTLTNVMFGDVWICSGQSNMQMTVSQAYNSSVEIAEAANYPNIRLFTVGQGTTSATPLSEFSTIEQTWSVASPSSVGGANWGYFSASCWFFAKNLYDDLQIPLGMVSSNWGGTYVQAWSSPIALSKCNSSESVVSQKLEKGDAPNPNTPSVLWNAMIVPLLPMRVKGAVWYQAEANVGEASFYACAFPAMISDWRSQFGLTPVQFGFYFVQLAPYTGPGTQLADMRLAQTAALSLPYTGFACIVDLGDLGSPFGNIHPRDKEDVGKRLSLSARAITYGENVQYLGPTFSSLQVVQNPPSAIVQINFEEDSIGAGLVEVSNECPSVEEGKCGWGEILTSDGVWTNSTVYVRGDNMFFAATVKSGTTVTGARYLYQEWPVPTVYNKAGLPAAPFYITSSK